MQSLALLALAIAPLALARTDLTGCTSSVSGPSLIWYVPGTGELCEFLDCGGGRAPPKTTVPGCAAYSGTATYSPNYLPGYGPNATPTSTAAASDVPQSSMAPTVAPGPVVISSTYPVESATGTATDSVVMSSAYPTTLGSSTAYANSSATVAPATTATGAVSTASAAPTVSTVTTRSGGTSTTASSSPSASLFAGVASGNNVAGGLGLIGFMAAALVLA